MRLNAYVLAGDPVWATQSLRSYYPLINELFVSFDAKHRSWAGHALDVDDTLRALRAADPDGKIRLLPGDYSDPERPSLEIETEQRQAVLTAAGESSDWVLQFDTDEILLSPEAFIRHLTEADRRTAEAMEYPARNVYLRVSGDRFLERSGRLWTVQSSYPGPLAVRSNAELRHCRQVNGSLYRVDVRPWNTDPAHSFDTRVHGVVRSQEAVAHMSWVRSPERMRAKARLSGHAATMDWEGPIRHWEWASRHPWLAVAGSPFARSTGHLRMARLKV